MKNKASGGSAVETDTLGVRRTTDQQEKDASNRRQTLVGVLVAARDADDLVLLVDMLQLGVELEHLVTTPERHQLLDAAQARLDELATSPAERH